MSSPIRADQKLREHWREMAAEIERQSMFAGIVGVLVDDVERLERTLREMVVPGQDGKPSLVDAVAAESTSPQLADMLRLYAARARRMLGEE